MTNLIENNTPVISTYSDRVKIAKSFDKGQGSNPDLCEKLDIQGLKVEYLDGVLSFNFKSQAQKDVHHAMLFNALLKDKAGDYIERLFKHLGSGEFLSLNHTDGNGSAISVDKYAQFQTLFESLGISEVKSNGKGSKLTQLICNPTPELVTILSVNGFENITPLIDGFSVIGLKVELPKQD
jgi:hypothetical protein